jgi:hypothetical protein
MRNLTANQIIDIARIGIQTVTLEEACAAGSLDHRL